MTAAALGGAAIQGGFGLLGTGLQYVLNKKLAKQQNQYNIDMWKMQNEYNSPQAQMQRFQEAGLNPNLIYGQGTSGNSSQAPQMVTPEAPRVDKAMEELGKAFHIEQLRKLHYEAETAKEAADAAYIANEEKRESREALSDIFNSYDYNMETGRFEFKKYDPMSITVSRDPTPAMLEKKRRTGAYSNRGYFFNNKMFDYHRLYEPLKVIPYRNAYYNALTQRVPNLNLQTYWQTRNLMEQYKNWQYQNLFKSYDWKYYPATFWIDRGSKVGNTLRSFLPF